ncbi:alpha-1,4-glucan--maltose-1-phosphate maltosyltransferase [Actinobacteria bacterium YIM 96077]|uniref:Alpha-1,4-glucan:maltose-1-phosphate maltosyltransferase n=1 Tax=Phytoactinopolyspora halophila TaxID=1981511 RepID=A0A329Q9Y7_9ACTN|nr:alpha-1,4-glucan--maltose-1-phosphate maltosyltransferase [Phytoactinopolyspora halophila]AYY12364.1 alpha-1,4-glucan--maltose-1-phosphate maltosyltransferase [Actinobacteria bacterium YIM 96077]RAW09215.1 alpha-1,4-glucan--maltose-1-phosphate maltosyltransferase [Phytoactinopolyspora halophila]
MTGRIPILDVAPHIECGRYPAKAVVGETFEVSATVFREGHDAVAASAVLKDPAGKARQCVHMTRTGPPHLDRWRAELTPDAPGDWSFTIEGWGDPFSSWRHAAEIKIETGTDVELMLTEGALLLERAATNLPRGRTDERSHLRTAARAVRDTSRPPEVRLASALDSTVLQILAADPLRDHVTEAGPFPLLVERERALYGAWYEFFPRSEGAVRHEDGSWTSGTFTSAAKRLPAIADMGFDVVYLPPIHPIGTTFRKGPNNTLTAGPNDPGVPWAIGSSEGGHDAVHPDLGDLDDFAGFVARARELGLEVALDLALQASPDHPWVTEHPEWFTTRADGTIAYAENPPKKYQDIYPLNFDNDPEGIYAEVRRVVRHWMGSGVRIFRVDNPHTKPVNFWHRLLADIRRTDPDVIFLSEAFTRHDMMHTLAKIGFQQSYTYFTWKNAKDELVEYLTELRDAAHYMRPNLFVNTPDILHAYLQYGGPAAFKVRATLGALLSPTWGMYSGFELFEHVAVRPGSEEYLDSEKYQYRPRDWEAYEPGGSREGQSLAPYITQLNAIRRAHPALHRIRNLRFHDIDNPEMLCFSKRERTGTAGKTTDDENDEEDIVLTVVNLDPHNPREATVSLNMPELGMDWHERFAAHDELTGATYNWGEHNYVRLDPAVESAHVLTVRRWRS